MTRKRSRFVHPIVKELTDDGWKTPDTYLSSEFTPMPSAPGVYLFLYKETVSEHGGDERVVYVGMSSNLRNRHLNHPTRSIIAKMMAPTGHVQCWFKVIDAGLVAQAEIDLIQKYDPSLNLQHRTKRL